MNKISELLKYKKDDLTTALIYIIGYPIVVYLTFEIAGPILFKLTDFSENLFSKFPFILIHGLLMLVLGVGCFFFFIVGFYLWIMFAYQIGNFLWSTYIKNNTEDE
ncbi:MAG: hypothetical protein ACW964_18015 [Candidatus Hodarchaeales archaeon]|jgi:hypothetical protein